MHYATLQRLSAKSDYSLGYILVDATEAWSRAVEIGDQAKAARYLGEISDVAHVLQTRALTKVAK